MNSTEEKKADSDFTDTASSEFYPRNSHTPAKSLHLRDDPSAIDSLEEQIARTRETLIVSHQLLKRLESNEELLRYVSEVEQELKVVSARGNNELGNAKLSFEKSFGSLERELASFIKSWKQIKEQAEAEIEEQISAFKSDIKKDETVLGKLLSTTTASIKSKTAAIALEVKETRRMRGQMGSNLMGMIELARGRMEAVTEDERKRRNEYESIVFGLLDRTVDQGERIMRRIC